MRGDRLSSLRILLALALVLPAAGVSAQTFDELFDGSVLHDIELTMKQSDWETLQENYLDDTYYRADMKWREVVVPMVGIRSRGSGSRNKNKPGLKVDFDRYLDQKPFGLKEVVLANGIQDPAMLKQRLGLGMFARMGMPAPRVVHARVFVNREYIGLYQLIESPDKTFLTRAMGQDAAGKAENGGYLYEYQWKDQYAWDYLGSDFQIYAELFEPKTHEDDAPSLLYGPLDDLFKSINEVSDAQFERVVGEQFDLTQFLKHLAVENFIAEYDGFLGNWGPNNFYLYRFQNRQQSQLLPWDKDAAFWDRQYDIFQGVKDNVLARRALSIPSLYRTYLEALIQCAQRAMEPDTPDTSTGWLEAEAQRIVSQIRAAGYSDENKRFDNERFDDELGKVLLFAKDRGRIVDHEARHALTRTSFEVAQPSLAGISYPPIPRYSSVGITQVLPGLRRRARPALRLWR